MKTIYENTSMHLNRINAPEIQKKTQKPNINKIYHFHNM